MFKFLKNILILALAVVGIYFLTEHFAPTWGNIAVGVTIGLCVFYLAILFTVGLLYGTIYYMVWYFLLLMGIDSKKLTEDQKLLAKVKGEERIKRWLQLRAKDKNLWGAWKPEYDETLRKEGLLQ